MKVSIRQVLASAAGAVVAATIASFFGVSGTIVGVAIGSMAATVGTALVAHSLDRTHQAVVHAAVRAPDSSLLRRIGGTSAEGAVTETVPTVPESTTPVTEETASSRVRGDARLVTKITPPGPPTAARPRTSTSPEPPWRLNWRVVAVTSVIVFVVALGVITFFELIAGRPLSSVVGGGGGGGISLIPHSNSTTTTTVAPTTTTTSTVPRTTTTSTTVRATTSTTGAASTTTTTAPRTSTSLPSASSGSATSTTRPR